MAKTCYFLFAFAFLLLISFQTPCVAKISTSLTTDQYALLSLKSFITSDPYHILTRNWTNSSSVCTWIGVTCGSHHHRVAALNISNFGISGTIPPHIGNLSFLVSLDLRYNFFGGSLPRELSLLHRLKFISLRNNDFAGEIPPWFGQLHKLEYLSLRNNSFNSLIPASFSNLSNLQYIDLANNSVHGKIPQELGRLRNLQILDMQYNELSGAIPSAMFNISTLHTIAFSSNQLGGTLPIGTCANLPLLEGIYLSNNQLSGEIPSNLSQCQQLQIVSLSYNSFVGQIPAAFGRLTSLQTLYLGGNFLYGVMPKEIGNLHNLIHLAIERNQITGALTINFTYMSSLQHLNLNLWRNKLSGEVSRDMGNLTMLKFLSLSENGFTGAMPREICQLYRLQKLILDYNILRGKLPRCIGNLTMLKVLDLRENGFTDVIPREIGRLYHLETLNLNFNSFSGSIPPEIFNISTLQILNLGFNYLSGTLDLPTHFCTGPNVLEWFTVGRNSISGEIPYSISNCAYLRTLDLTGNKLTGIVPHSLGNLSLLEFLGLEYNNLTIESPSSELSFITSLTKCTSLRALYIGNNPLDGIIPSSIGNFSSNLQLISACNCKIRGSIPDYITNLTNLSGLDLSDNKLSGIIPPTFRNMFNLQRLDLHSNNLEGPIPEGLSDLHRLFSIHLSQNKLSGPIPQFLGNVSSLREIFLDSNKLNSSIPSSLWSLRDLLSLDLSSNSLSGFLASEIGNLVVSIYVNLSVNNFSGSIPNTFGKLQSLVNLSLAHNRFKSSIPVSVGSLISLVTLDFSYNNLSGSIPRSLEKLQHLDYFNVSFNTLIGEIPSGGPFKNFTTESFKGNDALCDTSRLHGFPICRTASRHKSTRKKMEFSLFIPVGVVALITVVALTFIYIKCKRKDKILNGSVELVYVVPQRISYYEILQATEQFNESNLLGVGSYGSVYKGTLRDGNVIAVKVFSQHSESAFRSFDVECEILRNIRHRNLTKVLSSCTNEEFKALVLEYMPNANLEKWLYSHNYFFDVRQRLDIMIDVASALEYLHHGYSAPIVHCDLKLSNVLLDEEMIAHVSDFGISKLLGDEESTVLTNTLATLGYIAPEYGLEGLVSTRCDVYSYGVMLMETFTRKRPSDDMFGGDLTLMSWVANLLPHSPDRVVDPNLFMNLDDEHGDKILQCVSSILVLALKCSTESPGEMINIKEALAELQKINRQFFGNT